MPPGNTAVAYGTFQPAGVTPFSAAQEYVGIEPVPRYPGTSPYCLLGRDVRPGNSSVADLV